MKAFLLLLMATWLWAVQYTCPMHPHYIADEFGSCPICGMDLVEKHTDDAPSNEAGRASVSIDGALVQTLGIQTELVQYETLARHIRGYGVVAPDESRSFNIASRISGWIDTLPVSSVGHRVAKGDLLYTLYSPDLISAQRDYIAALAVGNQSRINATANRLKQLGVAASVLKSLQKSKKPMDHVPFYAPANGTASAISIEKGSYVQAGSTLMRFEDYDSMWVIASVNEQDLPWLEVGGKVHITLPHMGGIERDGTIDYIYPTLDAKTKKASLRIVLPNKRGKLHNNAYVDVAFEADPWQRLSVASDAILRHSDGDYVVVAVGGGKFKPKKVLTGFYAQGRVSIEEGLFPGESVVVNGQFLLDSESAMRDAFRDMSGAVEVDHAHH